MKMKLLLSALGSAMAGAMLLFPNPLTAGPGGGGGGHGGHGGSFHSGGRLGRASFAFRNSNFALGFYQPGGWGGYYGGWGWGGGWGGGWGWGGGLGWDYPYYGGGYGYNYPGYYSYAPAPYSYADSSYSRPSYLWVNARPIAPAPDTVEIDVRLPSADAKVWVDGKAMDQTGVVRKFKVSSSGATQTVEVRTEWNEGNSKQERKRVIQVRAGQQVYSNLAIADKDNASPRAE